MYYRLKKKGPIGRGWDPFCWADSASHHCPFSRRGTRINSRPALVLWVESNIWLFVSSLTTLKYLVLSLSCCCSCCGGCSIYLFSSVEVVVALQNSMKHSVTWSFARSWCSESEAVRRGWCLCAPSAPRPPAASGSCLPSPGLCCSESCCLLLLLLLLQRCCSSFRQVRRGSPQTCSVSVCLPSSASPRPASPHPMERTRACLQTALDWRTPWTLKCLTREMLQEKIDAYSGHSVGWRSEAR